MDMSGQLHALVAFTLRKTACLRQRMCLSGNIAHKSVTTQNLAFLSYWYRKKCLQVHL